MIEIEITTNLIQKRMERHPIEKYEILMDYYKGDHVHILKRPSPGSSKPDNRLINNFPGYIVDVNLGYFMGVPVRYTSKTDNEEFLDALKDIFEYNDEHDENVELSKEMGIKGHVFEIIYFDEEGKIRFNVVKADNVIMVYDYDIEPTPLYAIRFWEEETPDLEKEFFNVEVYTPDSILKYQGTKYNTLEFIEETPHPFGDVPIVEFLNNEERQSDFEKVLELIDGYDKAQSDTANDFEYFSDAYLKIKGMMGTDSNTVDSMRENRVLLLSGDGDADWLIKHINDEAEENYKNRLVEDIHKFSKTANLTDESFAGNLSGVALKYKLWGMEQNTAQKERKFKRGLQRRIELITNYLSITGKKYDWRDIEIVFSRNVPENILDITEMTRGLKGTVSEETLLSQIPFVEDPRLEIEKIQEEQKQRIIEKVDLMQYVSDLSGEGYERDDYEESNDDEKREDDYKVRKRY